MEEGWLSFFLCVREGPHSQGSHVAQHAKHAVHTPTRHQKHPRELNERCLAGPQCPPSVYSHVMSMLAGRCCVKQRPQQQQPRPAAATVTASVCVQLGQANQQATSYCCSCYPVRHCHLCECHQGVTCSPASDAALYPHQEESVHRDTHVLCSAWQPRHMLCCAAPQLASWACVIFSSIMHGEGGGGC